MCINMIATKDGPRQDQEALERALEYAHRGWPVLPLYEPVTPSPVAADGKIYFTSEVGDVHVFQIGREYKPLSVNPLGEICMATPAISQGVLFFHTQRHVVAVGE